MPVIKIRNVSRAVYERAVYHKTLMGCRSWGEFMRLIMDELDSRGLLYGEECR
jgi:hypothetical protein